jgi:hypothetical protein
VCKSFVIMGRLPINRDNSKKWGDILVSSRYRTVGGLGLFDCVVGRGIPL